MKSTRSLRWRRPSLRAPTLAWLKRSLKDHRASGSEPVAVLSQYRYQDGLGYYETTRDTASQFFIDYLPKGTYVFEYDLRVQHKGKYQTGMAEIQCMYAPEFCSHSESFLLEVK